MYQGSLQLKNIIIIFIEGFPYSTWLIFAERPAVGVHLLTGSVPIIIRLVDIAVLRAVTPAAAAAVGVRWSLIFVHFATRHRTLRTLEIV